MKRRVVVIGAGVGGLTAAIRLAQHGFEVNVFEARANSGGLASKRTVDGFVFDAGPYILLDRPGLEWVFAEIGLSLDEHLPLERVAEVYEVTSADAPPVRIYDSLEETVQGLELHWPKSGDAYRKFIDAVWSTYGRLQPLQRISKITLAALFKTGAWREVAFLWRSLDSVLRRTGLPEPISNAIGIWTHVAGQTTATAPSPLAFVPALIHHAGAWYPINGIGSIPETLTDVALKAGVQFHFENRVTAIRSDSKQARGIEIEGSGFVPADTVVANAHGVGTYIDLLNGEDRPVPRGARKKLERLPLQSPGVCAYLAVKGRTPPPYLRFRLPGADELCRLLISPSVLSNHVKHITGDWWPARLMAPMNHDTAESRGDHGQREYLDKILAEDWWRKQIIDYRVLATRLPCEWGREFHLYRKWDPLESTCRHASLSIL